MSNSKSDYKKCKHCKQKIIIDANVCHLCGHNQSSIWNIVDKGGPLTAIIMVIIAIVQIIIAFQQMLETKAEHIEASDALERSKLAEAYADTALFRVQDILYNTKKEAELFENFLRNTEKDFKNKYNMLSIEVNKLKLRNHITQLGDSAISLGSKKALMKLKELAKSSSLSETKLFTKSEILRVYSMHQSIAYIEPVLSDTIEGKIIREDDYKTEELIDILKNDNDWKKRASSARLLGTKKEKGVPEELINAIKNDKNLFVIRWATESFVRLTGYEPPDLFDLSDINNWWRENSQSYYKKLD